MNKIDLSEPVYVRELRMHGYPCIFHQIVYAVSDSFIAVMDYEQKHVSLHNKNTIIEMKDCEKYKEHFNLMDPDHDSGKDPAED